jgi:hypothetical protein
MIPDLKPEDIPEEFCTVAFHRAITKLSVNVGDAQEAIEEIGKRLSSLEQKQQAIMAFIEPLGRLSWRLMEQIKINMSDENKKAIEALGEAAGKIGFVK